MKLIINENQLKKLVNVIKEENSDGKLNVLFVGDSLSSAPGYTWNYKLADKNSNKWNSAHLVKGGVRTGWMLDELRSKLNQGKKYDLVFIYGGTNDMFSLVTKNEAISNINKMADLVAEQGGKTIVFAGYDAEKVMSEKSHSNGGNLMKTRYCSEECMLKSRKKMIEFQDALPSEISGENVMVIPKMPGGNPSWAGDGTHVGPSVHNDMANYVNDRISGKVTIKDKTKKKDWDWDFGFNFLGGLKKYLSKYLSSTFGSLFGEKKLTNKFVSDLEKITEHNINSNRIISENKILEIGDVNEKVALFQLALQLLGYSLNKWGVDGIFGPETKKAVKDFQRDNNLEETGKITTKIKNKIISMIKNTITDEDFTKINFTKTESLPASNAKISGNSFSKVTGSSSIVDKFKNVLKQNNLDYSNFVNELNNIGLNPNIAIKQLYAESGFRSDVISCKTKSSAGAEGIAQFIPSTWDYYGAGGSPCNVKDSLKAYVKLMKDLIKMFPNRIDLAIAGYNSGPYLSIYKKALNNDLSFDDIKYDIPSETRGYVEKILFSN
jgi:peptidoglycan hydrolase-like protein with peptidoglycan-binding domain/lysophospholipase L1-like esterase